MDIKQEVEERYSKLTEKEKEALAKKYKKEIKDGIITIVVMFSVVWSIFICLITGQGLKEEKLIVGVLSGVMVVFCASICLPVLLMNKNLSDEKRAKKKLECMIKAGVFANQTPPEFVLNENIVRVKILDAFTEVTDKLHAVLNYQEIIQTRYYKFKVDYKDGHSDIITEKEGTARCMALMKFIDEKSAENDKQVDSAEELKKYKGLFDDGLISEEEYNAKKKQILGL